MNRDLVESQLAQLETVVAELKRQAARDRTDSLAELWAVQHGLQIAIQTVLDIGAHLLSSKASTRSRNTATSSPSSGRTGS